MRALYGVRARQGPQGKGHGVHGLASGSHPSLPPRSWRSRPARPSISPLRGGPDAAPAAAPLFAPSSGVATAGTVPISSSSPRATSAPLPRPHLSARQGRSVARRHDLRASGVTPGAPTGTSSGARSLNCATSCAGCRRRFRPQPAPPGGADPGNRGFPALPLTIAGINPGCRSEQRRATRSRSSNSTPPRRSRPARQRCHRHQHPGDSINGTPTWPPISPRRRGRPSVSPARSTRTIAACHPSGRSRPDPGPDRSSAGRDPGRISAARPVRRLRAQQPQPARVGTVRRDLRQQLHQPGHDHAVGASMISASRAGAALALRRPLVVIRFDRPKVAYKEALYNAVSKVSTAGRTRPSTWSRSPWTGAVSAIAVEQQGRRSAEASPGRLARWACPRAASPFRPPPAYLHRQRGPHLRPVRRGRGPLASFGSKTVGRRWRRCTSAGDGPDEKAELGHDLLVRTSGQFTPARGMRPTARRPIWPTD